MKFLCLAISSNCVGLIVAIAVLITGQSAERIGAGYLFGFCLPLSVAALGEASSR